VSSFDAIVVGVGGMGSATAYHLAKRGWSVLGLERFDIPNAMGSSHGVTRIIRLAYYEDVAYVPLLRRAYELWDELERGFGEELLVRTGSIDGGPEDGRCFTDAAYAARVHELPHELLDAARVNARFPGYQLPAGMRAVWQPDGGFLVSERCIVAHVVAAQAHGAEIRARERVLGWESRDGGVRVTTDRGVYDASRLVIAAGAWAGEVAGELRGAVVAERQVLAWLQPFEPELFSPGRFPVFNLEMPEGRYYGLPVYGVPGFKFGRYHHRGEVSDADAVDREPNAQDEALLRAFAETYFPQGAGPTMALRVCMFENSPDEHFIIDRLPRLPEVVVAAGFSGHGFKFCSVVGEIVADLCQRGETRHDVSLFRISRLGVG
jgi:sarcosine oxidase